MSHARLYPIRGTFKFPPSGLVDAVLRSVAEPGAATRRPQVQSTGILAHVRRWQRDQPEQFAELAAVIRQAPRKTVVRLMDREAHGG